MIKFESGHFMSIKCGFIGLGLIGGSIARALKEKYHDDVTIVAYDIDASALSLAAKQGIADIAASFIDDNFSNCNYLFLCAPVENNNSNILQLKKYLSSDCILTDVGSVKGKIHKQIAEAGLSEQFIGGHPMAGSERTGFANSKARLLENAYYILTPTDTVSDEKIQSYSRLVKSMGAIPLILDAAKHDYVTAAVSHLPHVIASSLVNLVKNSDSSDGIMKMIAAGGFKDITRIASSSSDMWQQICTVNSGNISKLLGKYISDLCVIKETIDAENSTEIKNFFESARTYRDSFIDAGSGPIKKVYCLYIDINDEPGALASIATILANNNISIKNIGITHNRETQEGALRIEFYEESAIGLAKSLLSSRGYTIYERK